MKNQIQKFLELITKKILPISSLFTRVQKKKADGVISTSKTAVEISLGLIGIMTLLWVL